jgi:hypothetical protein
MRPSHDHSYFVEGFYPSQVSSLKSLLFAIWFSRGRRYVLRFILWVFGWGFVRFFGL